jgi:hypothetical protein
MFTHRPSRAAARPGCRPAPSGESVADGCETVKYVERALGRVDRQTLERELDAAFDGSAGACRVVARQARDLADSGRIEADLGFELAVADVVDNMADAPDGYSLVERWNWWLSSLELSHGGYNRFRVRPDAVEEPDS